MRKKYHRLPPESRRRASSACKSCPCRGRRRRTTQTGPLPRALLGGAGQPSGAAVAEGAISATWYFAGCRATTVGPASRVELRRRTQRIPLRGAIIAPRSWSDDSLHRAHRGAASLSWHRLARCADSRTIRSLGLRSIFRERGILVSPIDVRKQRTQRGSKASPLASSSTELYACLMRSSTSSCAKKELAVRHLRFWGCALGSGGISQKAKPKVAEAGTGKPKRTPSSARLVGFSKTSRANAPWTPRSMSFGLLQEHLADSARYAADNQRSGWC